MINLEIKNNETKNVIRRLDVTDKSLNAVKMLQIQWRAEFDDKFNLENSIGVNKVEDKQKIVSDKENEVREPVSNIIEMNNNNFNFYKK